MRLKTTLLAALVCTILAAPFVSYQLGKSAERSRHNRDYVGFTVDYCENTLRVESRNGDREFNYQDNIDSLLGCEAFHLSDSALVRRIDSLTQRNGVNLNVHRMEPGWDFGTSGGCYGYHSITFSPKESK